MPKRRTPRATNPPVDPDVRKRMNNWHRQPVTVVLSDRTVKYDPIRLMVGGGGGLAPGQPCPGQFFARSPAQRAKRRRRQGRR